MLPRRIRLKSDLGADPTWAASNIDPNTFTAEIGGTTADGAYAIDIVPEDPDVETISIEFDRQDSEDDGDIGDELAVVGTTLIGTTLGPYLRSIESDGAGVLTMRALTNALPFRVELRAPVGATFGLDADEVWPITDFAGGQGQLFIEFVATDGGVPLAPGSATLDVQLLSVVDRRRPTGKKVTAPDATLAVTATDEAAVHPIGEPLVVASPPGFFTVSITGSASLPAGTDGLEVWVGLTGA
jgi:hypothetical protein